MTLPFSEEQWRPVTTLKVDGWSGPTLPVLTKWWQEVHRRRLWRPPSPTEYWRIVSTFGVEGRVGRDCGDGVPSTSWNETSDYSHLQIRVGKSYPPSTVPKRHLKPTSSSVPDLQKTGRSEGERTRKLISLFRKQQKQQQQQTSVTTKVKRTKKFEVQTLYTMFSSRVPWVVSVRDPGLQGPGNGRRELENLRRIRRK